ncbi:DUF4082 domain-containing protein [Sphaerisporangium fuscum]|uniref:DUF4082 domain-containing protein n=1 Tax=Sphaerisporangium fuscum TaxID=2835868 RepID=UPI001BDD268A|nr:DUF4082 domain-containing protein [Sphaerisporangium fuscum]
MSALGGVVVLGTAATVVLTGRETPSPAPKTFAAPASSEVTLESSLWKTKKTVKGKTGAEHTPLELGTRFKASSNGEVTGIRFYKPASEKGTHRGSLWSSDRKLLAKVTFKDETGSGWQQATFDKPVPIVAGRTYTVSYHTQNGGYVGTAGAFDKPVKSGPLTAEAGVFAASDKAAFPFRVHRDKVNYWVDVVFRHRERRTWPQPTGRPTGDVTTVPSTRPTSSASQDPTTTPTGSPRPSGGVTTTPTSSPSPKPSETVTPTRTASPSRTPTGSPSPSHTASPTRTATRTPSPEPSTTKPVTPRPTLTVDPTKQPTQDPKPPTGSFPGSSDTGPSGALKSHKGGEIRENGAVLENVEFTDSVDVYADNVTIRNCRVVVSGYWGIQLRDGHKNLTIENCEIAGRGSSQLAAGVKNLSDGLITITGNDIHDVTDGIMTGEGVIQDNYIHDLKAYPGDHVDGIQTDGTTGKLVISHNTVSNPVDQTSAIMLDADLGPIRNVTVENNLLSGGGYCFYGGSGRSNPTQNVVVAGNVFSRELNKNCGEFGAVAHFDQGASGNVWKNNVYDDGKPVNP